MNLKEFINLMESYAPCELCEEYDIDKIGFIFDLTKYKNKDISNVGVCLDVTKKVVENAKKDNIDVLICHHNPFFDTKFKIDQKNSEIIKHLSENNTSIYCIHTNYDNVYNGMNFEFSKALGLKNLRYLNGLYIGYVDNYSTDEFVKYISKKLNITNFSYIGNTNIKKILICCGSGFTSKNLLLAKENNVDAFISSEWKHSSIVRNRENITLINISHYDMENIGMKCFAEKLKSSNLNLNVFFYEDSINLKTI